MENEEYTVDTQDEIKDSESEETTEVVDSEGDENSTQLHEELKKKDAEIAKLNRLLKKGSKSSDKEEKEEVSDKYVTKADLDKIRLEAKGYDDDQIEFIMSVGGVDALKKPAIKKVVESIREEKEQLNAQASTKSQSKSSKTYSQEEIRAMPVEKLEQLIREGKIKNI